jgi:hypothetical protein
VIGASNLVALRDPRQWRLYAERIRNVADSVNDPMRRRSMLDIADKYERVGKFIERQRLDLLKQPAARSNDNAHSRRAPPLFLRRPAGCPGNAVRRV